MSKQTLGIAMSWFRGRWTTRVRVYDSVPRDDSYRLDSTLPEGTYSIGNLTFRVQRRDGDDGFIHFRIIPGPGTTLCDGDPNHEHGISYFEAVDAHSCKEATVAVHAEKAHSLTFVDFAPHEKAPKHWISIVNTPSGHAILFENGATPLFGHTGILRFHTIEEMKEKKKVGDWSFHLGSASLPIIMEITRITQSASEEHNGNCDIVFRPVDGSLIRCFNGNPHFMGRHLQECGGFQVSLEWQISHNGPRDFEVTNVTYLPLEQDK